MLIKRNLFLITFSLLFYSLIAQEFHTASKINSFTIKADTFLGFDNQKNYYSLNNNTLSKTNGKTTYQYNNLALGKITNVDFQNPLQLVVFYKTFNTVVLLDNQLNEIKKINFNSKSVPITLEAVALSSQNQIWVYDSVTSKIGLYNINSETFKWISTVLENPILSYESDYTHFYWTDLKLNLYRISIYGTIEKLGNLPNYDAIQLTKNGNSLYVLDNKMYYYNLITKSSSKIKIDEKIISNFFFKDGILSIFTQNEITNYKIILP
ncbi:hypothetical protein NAT47_11465 [Flavobacterium sp. HXWNR69]|uniref:ATP-binding protein n=1 Tax=Flavobacterium fragile TaxID=2949085 RepID=A0ABT0TJP2_9FLAO|nr:hypothetical protein [Flavobacterium sp. HXWNR69]MCL9771033.1 hypothetical protein [Flavobacterium sp. HXWNR69]